MSKVGKKIEAGLTPAQERALAGFDSLPNAAHVDVHVVAAVKGISVPSVWRWARNGLYRTILLMWSLRLRYFFGADPQLLVALYSRGQFWKP